MAKCKPVFLDQLVGGQQYLHVEVGYYGDLWLETFTYCGVPSIFDGERVIRVLRCDHATCLVQDPLLFAGHVGLTLDRPNVASRFFRHTGQNRAVLTDLVDRQALPEYLALIMPEDANDVFGVYWRRVRATHESAGQRRNYKITDSGIDH